MFNTLINILGSQYYLWIKGIKDQETQEYTDFLSVWESGELLSLSWHITAEDDPTAPRVAFDGDQVVLKDRDEQGSVFGYIWCSKEGMAGRNGYAHGLVGMRYGQEKAKDSVFFDASSLEFKWRLSVSRRVWQYMQWKQGEMKAPSGMGLKKVNTIEDKPELFKTKISKLAFREKLMRYRRKPTTAVYQAIVDEFITFTPERKLEVVGLLQKANFNGESMVELVDELYDIGRKEAVAREKYGQEQELPAGL